MEKNQKSFFARFSILDLVTIALLASLGIASKPLVAPFFNFLSSSFFLPKGALQTGIYMFWLVLSRGIVGKFGAGTLTALVQAVLVMTIGLVGNQGIVSLITYSLPGLAIDLVSSVWGKREFTASCAALSCIAASLTAFSLSSFLVFRLPIPYFLLGLFIAAVSGFVGGLIAYVVLKKVKQIPFAQRF